MLNLPLYIALRYTRAKRRNGFISFISLTSMIGIALGVAVLITVLSVMNGFDRQIHDRVFSLTPAISVTSLNPDSLSSGLGNWQTLAKQLSNVPKVLATAPFVEGQGLLRFNGNVQPALVMGVLPAQEEKMNALNQMMTLGQLDNLKEGEFGIILGSVLATNLGISSGDKVVLVIPKVSINPAGVMPVFKRFTVEGFFHAGNGFGFDARLAYIHMKDAQKLFQLGDKVSGINIKINEMYQAPFLAHQLQQQFPNTYVSNWTNQYGAFFKAVQLEKTMMFLILTMIIAVAAFNLVSTLVMVVTDKKADIAILRTLGATPKTILMIFILQGSLIGIIGTLLGVLGGTLLALNATAIVNGLQSLLHVQLFSASVYFVDYLPSELSGMDVLQISITAVLLSLLATLYPAWKASRIQPAEALRYE